MKTISRYFYKLSLSYSSKSGVKSELFRLQARMFTRVTCSYLYLALFLWSPTSLMSRNTFLHECDEYLSVFLAVPEIEDGDKMIVMLMIMKGEQDHPCLLNLQFKKPKGKIQDVSVTPMG